MRKLKPIRYVVGRHGLQSVLACVAFAASAAVSWAVPIQVCLRSEGRLAVVARDVPSQIPLIEASLASLAAGPTTEERAAGIDSAIPPGTTIVGVTVNATTVTVEFSPELVAAPLDEARVEAVFEQVAWTLRTIGFDGDVKLMVGQRPLSDYLPPIGPVERRGMKADGEPAQRVRLAAGTALAGKSISLSPGHGLYWAGSSWNYERPVYCAPLSREDHHNVDLTAYLNTYLAQDGATTKSYRCLEKGFGANPYTGDPWWYMSGSYWIKSLGYPCSVYANSTGDCTLGSGASESSDNVRSRPLASDYDDTDIHIAMHTNGYQGDCAGSDCPNGTCTYYDASAEHAAWAGISQDLAANVNTGIVDVIRNHYGDSTWRNRGSLDADGAFAETRIPNRAAILIELAFHDSCDRDGLYLRDNFFRSATMWGVYKGICDYVGVSPTYAFYSDEYVSDTIPSAMRPGLSYNVSVTFRNRGVLWTENKAIRLGAVGDSDPFTSSTRVLVSGEVDTGQTSTFSFTMTAPMTGGVYSTDWRMLREGVTWFGATHREDVQVGIPGDFNFDEDVDQEDFAHLQRCFSGSSVPQSDPACQDANLDRDSDVDEYDFVIFQNCLSGPEIPADPYCAS